MKNTHKMTKSILMLALTTTSAWALEMPAFAQDAATATDANEIIVSARRRTESLQDTPVAITAVNAAMLENKASMNIGDLMGAAPNLLITNQNSGAAAANLSIRGLTYADIEKSQEPTVGVVVDGVFIGTSTGQFFDFFDIEQIEVLRGPQGTLFGRNTIGGVINIKRTRPTGEVGGKMEVSYGRWNTLATRAVLNTPVIPGLLSAKAFYFHNESDGYYHNAYQNKRGGMSNNDNFGASFLFAPEGSGFDALLTLEKQNQEFDPVVSNLTNSSELFCGYIAAEQCNRNNTKDLYTIFTLPALSQYSAPAATLEMNYDLGGIALTSVTGFRKSRENQTQDFDGSTTDLYYVRRQQKYRQFSQELRGAGKFGDNFDYVVGAYYFKSRYMLLQHTRLFGVVAGPNSINIDPVDFDTNPQLVHGRTTSYAFFGDFNWEFMDRWRLSFGGRYTHDKKYLDNGFGTGETFGLIGAGSGTFEKFTPKVGVDFRPDPNTMFYASWSRGYRSGGFSPRAATAEAASTPYQPETVDTFEVGTKLDLVDRKVQLNLAAFYSKYKDLQQNTTIPGGPTGNQTITTNVGSAIIKGFEGDFTVRPVDGLKLTGSFGYLDNNLKNFITQSANVALPGLFDNYNYSSVDMIYAPKFNASIAAEYTMPTSFGEVIANISYRYIGRYDQQISLGNVTVASLNDDGSVNYNVGSNDPRVRTDRQGLVDASLTTKFDLAGTKAKFTVFGRNLANDKGATHGFTVAGLWSFGMAREPRTYGASLGIEF